MRSRSKAIPSAPLWPRSAVIAIGLAVLAALGPGCAKFAGRPQLVIGAANPADIDYPLGGSVCRLFNLATPRHGLKCTEEPTEGAQANIDLLGRGRIDIGIVPSDMLADASAGRGAIASFGPAADLRVLFAGHADIFTFVVHQGSGIRTVADLRGKRIGLGIPGSRQRTRIERVMAALGLAQADSTDRREYSPEKQHQAFCANELDAIIYSVAHPNGLIRDATVTCLGMLASLTGPEIDRMLAEHAEFERAVIAGGTYPANPVDVHTFSVRAMVVTTRHMPDTVAHEIARAVFDNFDDFRQLHPTFDRLAVADMIRPGGGVPLHPGAARYYRERNWLP